MAVSADGRRAVSASLDTTLKVWDVETGALVTTFTCDAAAYCCAFNADDQFIAGDEGGHVHFLHLETPLLHSFCNPSGGTMCGVQAGVLTS